MSGVLVSSSKALMQDLELAFWVLLVQWYLVNANSVGCSVYVADGPVRGWVIAQVFGVMRCSRTVAIVLWIVKQNERNEGHEGCYKSGSLLR